MPVDSVINLVILIRQHRLLETRQLDELARTIAPNFAEPRSLAKELMQRNWLTPYQINQLFQGRGADLCFENFLLLERLGEGGMGQVFKAKHRKLGQIVALKIIRKDRNAGPDSIRRFKREIETASTLVHPNVVRAIDAGEIDGSHFFVMEYVEGTDLAKLLKQQGPLPPAVAADYIRQAALGLQHACEMGLVHRDIKPANLLLTKQGVVKLVDMGLARRENVEDAAASTALTQEGSVLGTPDYIAPEQARNSSNADIRADIYSLGCTFYFLLTGQPPFPGGALTEKLLKHQLDSPAPVSTYRSDVPPVLLAVLDHMLQKRPEDRYQTPGELAAALANGTPPPSRKSSGARPNSGSRPPSDSGRTPGSGSYPVATAVKGDSSSQHVPIAVPVTGDPFADLETPGPVSITRVIPPKKSPPPLPLWLLAVVAAIVVILAVLGAVGAKLLFSKPKPTDDSTQNKDKDAAPADKEKDKTDKDSGKTPVKPSLDWWAAREALAKKGAHFVPAAYDPVNHVTSIDLSGSTTVTDADLVNLEALPTLTVVRLGGTKITDKGLVHLESLMKLTTLWLYNTAITDAGLAYLKGLTELQELHLSGTQVHGGGLVHLQGARKLTSLNLSYSKVDDGGLTGLETMPQLEVLNLQLTAATSQQITDAGMVHLKGLTKLKSLWLTNTAVTDAGMVHFKDVGTHLTTLDLTNVKVTDAGLSCFKRLNLLHELQAAGSNVGDNGLPALHAATHLQTVGLAGTKVQNDGLAVFADKKELLSLSLMNTRVGDSGLDKLAGPRLLPDPCPPAAVPGIVWSLQYVHGPQKLQTLYLDKTLVTDAGLVHLSRLRDLTSLSLTGTEMRGSVLAQLKWQSKLTTLMLDSTLLDDSGLAATGELTQLTTLSLSGSHNFTDAGVVHLKKLTNLKALNLSNTPISDVGLKNVEEMKTLQTLNLAQTTPRVTEEGVKKLTTALPKLVVTR